METQFSFGVKKPCSENWANMTPTDKGAYCSACALEVRDFSQLPLDEVVEVLKSEMGKRVCGRLSVSQERNLRNTRIQVPNRSAHMRQISLFAFIAVFGITLFSCSTPIEENFIRGIQNVSMQIVEKVSPPDSLVNKGLGSSNVITIDPINDYEYMMGDISVEYFQAPTPPPRVEEPEVEESVLLERPVRIDEFSNPDGEHVLGELSVFQDFSVRAFPNPTAGALTITIYLPEGEKITIELIDQQGTVRQSVFVGKLSKGSNDVQADLNELPAGVYFIQVSSKNSKETQRVVKI